MQISRRDALMGASAAAVATGATVAPLAIKAVLAGVPMPATADVASAATAVPASASDARIFALVEEHDRTFAEKDKAKSRWCDAVTEKMPSHLRDVGFLDHKDPLQMEAWDAVEDIVDYPEVEVLRDKENRLKQR